MQLGRGCAGRLMRVSIVGVLIAGLVVVSGQARANPFENGFLSVCGEMVLSGAAPRTANVSGLRTYRVEDGSGYVCHFFEAVQVVPAVPMNPGKQWLASPDEVVQSFEDWVTHMRTRNDLIHAPECLFSFTKEDVVTERIFARAVRVGQTGRAMMFEITRRQNSYLDADAGVTVTVSGFGTNIAGDCPLPVQ